MKLNSPYYIPSRLAANLTTRENSFAVLSLNAQSILAKFNGLQVRLELFTVQNIHFPVICIQETWLQDETNYLLDGCKCFHVNASSSSHGGLITDVDDRFDVTVTKIVNNSIIWDGLFLKLNHDSLQNKLTVGKIYNPLEITIMSVTKLLSGRNWNLFCKN